MLDCHLRALGVLQSATLNDTFFGSSWPKEHHGRPVFQRIGSQGTESWKQLWFWRSRTHGETHDTWGIYRNLFFSFFWLDSEKANASYEISPRKYTLTENCLFQLAERLPGSIGLSIFGVAPGFTKEHGRTLRFLFKDPSSTSGMSETARAGHWSKEWVQSVSHPCRGRW